nr:hypothetical protein [uncultured Cupriavidus sp.]
MSLAAPSSPASSLSPSDALATGPCCRSAGHVLFEALLCIAIVGLGAIPLATLGSTWLRWTHEHQQLSTTLQLAAERAEAGVDEWPLVSGDAQRAMLCERVSPRTGCIPGTRLAMASLPEQLQATGVDAPPTRIVLWVSP